MEFSGCDKGNKTKSDAEDEENRADPQEHAGHTAVRSVPQLLQERRGNVVAVEGATFVIANPKLTEKRKVRNVVTPLAQSYRNCKRNRR